MQVVAKQIKNERSWHSYGQVEKFRFFACFCRPHEGNSVLISPLFSRDLTRRSMAPRPQAGRTSVEASSQDSSSSDEESLPPITRPKKELTLQDDDNAIQFQALRPEDEGKTILVSTETERTVARLLQRKPVNRMMIDEW